MGVRSPLVEIHSQGDDSAREPSVAKRADGSGERRHTRRIEFSSAFSVWAEKLRRRGPQHVDGLAWARSIRSRANLALGNHRVEVVFRAVGADDLPIRRRSRRVDVVRRPLASKMIREENHASAIWDSLDSNV
jgi:hypothetical protein